MRGGRSFGRFSLKVCVLLQACIVSSAGLPGLADAQTRFADQCQPDQYFDRGNGSDPVITEFAIALTDTRCPSMELPAGGEYVFPVGRTLHFWMRVQGSAEYARSPRVAGRIDARFNTIRDGASVFFDAFDLRGRIDANLARAEAEGSGGGRFDWRFGANKSTFAGSELYEISIWQGDQNICIKDPKAINCAVRFRVR